ncbi:hypothetical protein L1887_17944 [Cichorium endivia]|nr:hypothetical protein L1887_17944 [Cichorium endivia]
MAAATHFKAVSMIFVVAAVLSASSVSGQDLGIAPTGMDSGSGYSLPVSGLILCASIIVSTLALIKN